MDKRKFLFLALLVAIGLCWMVGQAAAQGNSQIQGNPQIKVDAENPKNVMPLKRDFSWSRLEQFLPNRLKSSSSFQRYINIYNANEQLNSNGQRFIDINSKGQGSSNGK